MIEQRSPEWHQQRIGKLTGSVVGAALGLNPWMTPEDLIRSMVRAYHGAESEFQGNIATEYGTAHEPLAAMDLLGTHGVHVEETGFHVHEEYDWLGASPDGFVDDETVVEIKCPFGMRNKKDAPFKSALEQPHYYAQMQTEMACTGRAMCLFFQWSPHGSNLEEVPFDQTWWDDNLPAMKSFYKWYESELDNPAHLEPLVKEVNTLALKSLLAEYDEVCSTLDYAASRKKELLQEIAEKAGEKDCLVHGRKLTQIERAGSISYAKAIKELAPNADLSKWQGSPTKYWKLS